MGRPADQEWARVAQLTQRTNQFNLSLVRRTLEDVKPLGRDRWVLVARRRIDSAIMVSLASASDAAGSIRRV